MTQHHRVGHTEADDGELADEHADRQTQEIAQGTHDRLPRA